MFRKQQKLTPFGYIFNKVGKPNTRNNPEYPGGKGRFSNIVTQCDKIFPNYNANVIPHNGGPHVLLEGPAQHLTEHTKRFFAVLMNSEIEITDVIAAGNPLDGRCYRSQGRGFLNYFEPDEDVKDTYDALGRSALCECITLKSAKDQQHGQITTYQLTLASIQSKQPKHINVHNIPEFGDFKTLTFSPEEISRLLEILQTSKGLAIHCSAGMGRSGVIELASCLFEDYDNFYPDDKPDFNEIKSKLEELRISRPAFVQTSKQYRMAIVLGMQLYHVNENQLTDEKSCEFGKTVDQAAEKYMQDRIQLRTAGVWSLKVEVGIDLSGFAYYNGEDDKEDVEVKDKEGNHGTKRHNI